MMKKLLLLLSFIAAVGQLKSQVLNVEASIQENNQWCWAAVSSCILDYYCQPTSQCTIAEYTRNVSTWHNFGSTNCCINATQGCNYWNYSWGQPGSIQDIIFHFGAISNYGVGYALTQPMVSYDIQNNRLFVIRWGWTGGGGHFLVGHGQIGNNLYYMDPWYGEGLKIADYNWVVSGDNHTWTHTNRISVTPSQSVPGNATMISGPTTVCLGDSLVTYSVPPILNAESYVWTLPNGATGSSDTTFILVDFSQSATAGNITVKAINSCGEGGMATLPITINPLPESALVISGDSMVCASQSPRIYTIPPINNATSYTWTLPIGATGSSTTNSISVYFGTTATSGAITVSGNNSCGQGGISSIPVLVNQQSICPIPYNYISFNNTPLSLYGWEGNKIVLLTSSNSLNPVTMNNWVQILDSAYGYFVKCTGREPSFYPRTYINNRATIAEVPATCGAGCGYVGFTGIEIQTTFFNSSYNYINTQNIYDQLQFYEFGRNFWFCADKLNYKTVNPISGGYAIFMRFMSMEAVNVQGAPFNSWTFNQFKNNIINLVSAYMSNPSLNWSNTLGSDVGIPNTNLSAADLFSSFCIYLRDNYCGSHWVENIWKYSALRPNAVTTQDAVDNFIIASSQAANTNLTTLFQQWKWPISTAAVSYLNSLNLGRINAQPVSVAVDDGSTAQFAVSSSDNAAVFQWQRNTGSGFQNLTNSSHFNGVNTNTLTILNASTTEHQNAFRCLVTIGSCTDTSESAILSVDSVPCTSLFNQDFNHSNIITDYINPTSASTNKFNSISASNGSSAQISNQSLVLSRITGGTSSLARIDNLSPAPLAVSFKTTISVTNTALSNHAVVFQIGSGMTTANATAALSNVYASFSVDFKGSNDFALRSTFGGLTSPSFSGTQIINWVLNNSGSNIRYKNPDGTYSTLANDKMDIYIGSTLLWDDISVNINTLDMTDFKIIFQSGFGTVTIDDININFIASRIMESQQPLTLSSDPGTCSKSYSPIAPPYLEGCGCYGGFYELSLDEGNTYKAYNVAPDFYTGFNTYAEGQHEFYWRFTDGCGNVSQSIESVLIEGSDSLTINSLDPFASSEGFPLTVKGENFFNISEVMISGISIPDFSVIGDTAIEVMVPPDAPNGLITVIDSSGCTASSDVPFVYLGYSNELTCRLFIEGLYLIDGVMNQPLMNTGFSSDSQVVDSIEISLYKIDFDLFNPTLVYRSKTTISANGEASIRIPGWINGDGFLISVKHRNSIETFSKDYLQLSAYMHYNFAGLSSAPTVDTYAPDQVLPFSTSISGHVQFDGGSPVTARGFCWGTSLRPTIDLTTKTINGSGTGAFNAELTGLIDSTKYYVRAYATNSVGTTYGYQHSFFTPNANVPVVTTNPISGILAISAVSGGSITDAGGAPITAKGVVWSTSPHPTINASAKTMDGTGSGNYISTLTGLYPDTTYYIRAYASNGAGTGYGDELIFYTLPSGHFMDINGNIYDTLAIGTQVWMKQNLNVSNYRNGDPIPTGLSDAAWSASNSGAYAVYNNNPSNENLYGKLYNWYAVVDPRGLCPAGWHVPSDAEWTTLSNFLGGNGVAGGKMKSVSPLWNSPNIGANNSSGFSALPAGNRDNQGPFGSMGLFGVWWSGTNQSTTNALYRIIYHNYQDIFRFNFYKTNGYSVRCLRD